LTEHKQSMYVTADITQMLVQGLTVRSSRLLSDSFTHLMLKQNQTFYSRKTIDNRNIL